MKLSDNKIELHSKGIQQSVKFSVANSAKVMRLLSDSLYGDKVAAPIRELSSNAYDSHVMAGCPDKPFLVHLPNQNDPTFSIRDYGVALTPEQMDTLYTTYGLSDKSESNDYVGALGLGSKSSLAYSDSFTVTSFKDGKKYIYIVGRDKDDIPTLHRMNVINDNESPNGLEVSFAVNSQDFSTFYERAKDIYKYFPVCPIIKGGYGKFEIPQPKVVLQGTGWRLCEGTDSESKAIMGCVSYSIDPKFFSKYYKESETWCSRYTHEDNIEIGLLELGLEIYFPIGDLDIAISREALQYNPTTIENIKKRLQIINQELKTLVDQQFTQCKTLWEAKCMYTKMRQKLQIMSNISKVIKPLWNNIDISKPIYLKNTDNITFQHASQGHLYSKKRYIGSIGADSKIMFYVNDIIRGACAIIKRDSSNKDCTIYLITLNGTNKERADALNEFINEVGIDKSQLTYISTLPKITVNRPYGPRKTKQFSFIPGSSLRYNSKVCKRDYWKETEVDLNGGGVYVELDGYTIKGTDGNTLNKLLKQIVELKLDIPNPIYGIRPSQVKLISNDGRWTNFYNYLKVNLNKYIKQHNLSKTSLEEIRLLGNLENHTIFIMSPDKLNMNKPAGELLGHINRVSKIKKSIGDKISSLTNLINVLQLELDEYDKQGNIFVPSKPYNFVEEIKKVMDHYPLLKLLNEYAVRSTNINDVVNYINLIDEKS